MQLFSYRAVNYYNILQAKRASMHQQAGRPIHIGSMGPRRVRQNSLRIRGKAAIKAAKRLTHIPGYYSKKRRGEIDA